MIALFHKEFVKAGIFPKDKARTSNRLFDLRVKEVERVLAELYRQ
jgi:hypothetical protein